MHFEQVFQGELTKMKSIIRLKSKKMLLIINIESAEKEALSEIMAAHSGEVKEALSDQGGEKLGYLLGFNGFEASGEKAEVTQRAAVFSGVDGKELNEILAAMRERGIKIPLKAVCTSHNQSWTLKALCEELEQEHRYMNGGRQGEQA